MPCVVTVEFFTIGHGQGREDLCRDIASVSRQGGATGEYQRTQQCARQHSLHAIAHMTSERAHATLCAQASATRDCRDKEALSRHTTYASLSR